MITWFYCLPWQVLLLVMPALTLAWGFRGRRCSRSLRLMGLLLWCGAILWITLLGRSPGEAQPFQPLFESYRQAAAQPELYRSNFMNILLFFPAGLLLCSLLPGKTPIRLITALGLLLALSGAMEYVQFRCCLGIPEADDILHNALGSLLGAGAAAAADLRSRYDKTR